MFQIIIIILNLVDSWIVYKKIWRKMLILYIIVKFKFSEIKLIKKRLFIALQPPLGLATTCFRLFVNKAVTGR